VKYKVFIVPEVLEQTREERTTKNGNTVIYSVCKVKYTFYADDGSSVQAVVVGEGMDSGDKATNKAMSIAFKYACFQTFCIPTEEMVDPDTESHEITPKGQKPPKTPPKQPNNPTKPTKEQILEIGEFAKKKGVDLKVKGVEWTGKVSSKEWTMDDLMKVAKILEEMEDIA